MNHQIYVLALTCAIAALLVGSLGAAPARAQPATEDRPLATDERPPSSPENVPDWAAPHSSTENEPRRSAAPDRSPPSFTTNDLSTPFNPDKTPLSGLVWLIAAGTGYGLWTLRHGRSRQRLHTSSDE